MVFYDRSIRNNVFYAERTQWRLWFIRRITPYSVFHLMCVMCEVIRVEGVMDVSDSVMTTTKTTLITTNIQSHTSTDLLWSQCLMWCNTWATLTIMDDLVMDPGPETVACGAISIYKCCLPRTQILVIKKQVRCPSSLHSLNLYTLNHHLLCNIRDCAYSAYPFPLWRLWGYICYMIESEVWPICLCLGSVHEQWYALYVFLYSYKDTWESSQYKDTLLQV